MAEGDRGVCTDYRFIQSITQTYSNPGWSRFLAVYQPILVQFARSRGLNETDAEEAAARCVENLLPAKDKDTGQFPRDGIHAYDPSRGKLRVFLYYRTLDEVTRIARRDGRTVELEDPACAAVDRKADDRPDANWEAIEERELFRQVFGDLRRQAAGAGRDAQHYDIFWDYAVECLDVGAVAEKYDKSVVNISKIKSRIRQELEDGVRGLWHEWFGEECPYHRKKKD